MVLVLLLISFIGLLLSRSHEDLNEVFILFRSSLISFLCGVGKSKLGTYWEHFSRSRKLCTFLSLRKDAGKCLGAAESHRLMKANLLQLCVFRSSRNKAEHTFPRGTHAHNTCIYICTSSHTDDTERKCSTHTNTKSISGLVLFLSLAAQDESPLV